MSHLSSTLLGRGQLAVAIAGGTGNLGEHIAKIFLSSGFKPFFSRVVLPTRDSSSQTAVSLAALGAEVYSVNSEDTNALAQILQGVDVVINVLGSKASASKDALVEAAVKSGVKVYFPSEFGSDHRTHEFENWESKEWIKKRTHLKRAQELSAGKMKIISVYTSVFLEDSLGPWFGFDFASRTLTCIGSPSTPITFTSKDDVGRALAQLAILSMSSNSSAASNVPDFVRMAGTTKSYDDVKRIFETENAEGGPIQIKSIDLQTYREEVKKAFLAENYDDPVKHIRIVFGEGKFDFSNDNNNELVNPGERVWKWKSMEDYAKETGGKGYSA